MGGVLTTGDDDEACDDTDTNDGALAEVDAAVCAVRAGLGAIVAFGGWIVAEAAVGQRGRCAAAIAILREGRSVNVVDEQGGCEEQERLCCFHARERRGARRKVQSHVNSKI